MPLFKKAFETEEKARLFKNYIALLVLQGANFIIPLITLPYLVRTLGEETFGLVMFAQAFILYFNIFVDFGFSLSGSREISIHRNNPQKLKEIFWSIMIIKAILTIVAFMMLSFIVFLFDKFSANHTLYFVTFAWVIGQALFPIWFFQGMEEMKYITIIKILAQLTTLVLLFLFVKSPDDYLLVPIFTAFGFIIAGAISMIIVIRKFRIKFMIPNFKTLKSHLIESGNFFLSRAAVSVYTSSNTFILGIFTNNTVVGYYAIAEKLYIALQAIYTPISQALYPFIAKSKNIALFKKIFYVAVLGNISAVVLLYFFSPYLVELVAGKNITQSSEIFQIFLLSALLVVPSILVGYPLLAAVGYKNEANYSVVFGAILHLVILSLITFLYHIDAYTVALALVATEAVVLAIRLRTIKKYRLWQNNEQS